MAAMTGESTTAPTYRDSARRDSCASSGRARGCSFRPQSGLIAIAVLFAVTDWRTPPSCWSAGTSASRLYLVLAFSLMARSDVHRLKRRAANQDEGSVAILLLIVAAAIASLGAIFAELGTVGGAPRTPGQLILATATVVMSWAFIHSIFALHYAHEFYGEGRDRKIGGMSFPDDQEPDYWDFTYFAFTIGMCAQVSDVTVSSKIDPPHRAGCTASSRSCSMPRCWRSP